MRTCVTHHHACDCREEKFRKMEAALAEARRGLEFYLNAEWIHFSKTNGNTKTSWGSTGHGGKTARTTLSGIDAILSEDERKEEG